MTMEFHGNDGSPAINGEGNSPLIRASTGAVADYGRMPTSTSSKDGESSGNLLRTVLIALRRRWLPILLLGGFVGGSAAIVAWQLIPTPYSAFSELLIKPQTFFFETKDNNDTNPYVFKQTMMRLVKDHYVLTAAMRAPGLAETETLRNEPFPLNWLERNISVSAPGEQFMRISLSGDVPEDLAKIVDAVTDAFNEEVVNKDREDRRKRLNELKTLLRKEEEKLSSKTNAIRNIDRALKLPNSAQSDAKRQATLDAQLEVRKQLGLVRGQIIQRQIQLGLGDPAKEGPEEPFAEPEIPPELVDGELLADPEFRRIFLAVRHHDTMLAEWKRRVSAEHPSVVRHEEQLSDAKSELEEYRKLHGPDAEERIRARASGLSVAGVGRVDLERELRTLTATREAYEAELSKLQVEENTLGVAWVDREELTEEAEELKGTVSRYREEVYKREVEMDNAPAAIQIRLRAQVPRIPDVGKRQKMAGMAGAGGFAAIAALFVWLEILARRITRTDEVKQGIGLAILGTIPLVPRSARLNRMKSSGPKAAYWHNVLSEAVDSMRTVLTHRLNSMQAVTVLVTSAIAGEGKTTLSCQLAASLARTRRRVLLIDCDLRRPSVQYAFGISHSPGLSEVLLGTAQLSEAIQHVESIGLDILAAGRVTSEVLQRLSHDSHSAVLKELSASYDFVVIDSSPVLPVTDTLLIAQHVDAVLISVRRDASRIGKVASAFHRLRMIGAPVLGAITTGLDEDLGSGYGSGYGYGYGGYGYGYGYGNGVYPARQPAGAVAALPGQAESPNS